MTQTIVVTETEFEKARREFVKAWTKQDELLQNLEINGAPGTRTRAGLLAALTTLGISVQA